MRIHFHMSLWMNCSTFLIIVIFTSLIGFNTWDKTQIFLSLIARFNLLYKQCVGLQWSDFWLDDLLVFLIFV